MWLGHVANNHICLLYTFLFEVNPFTPLMWDQWVRDRFIDKLGRPILWCVVDNNKHYGRNSVRNRSLSSPSVIKLSIRRSLTVEEQKTEPSPPSNWFRRHPFIKCVKTLEGICKMFYKLVSTSSFHHILSSVWRGQRGHVKWSLTNPKSEIILRGFHLLRKEGDYDSPLM